MATADRLSKLPDGILLDIISRLWTDEMVRTSLLSSRWRRLWTASPVLRFTRAFSGRVSLELEDYVSIVDHCLRQCYASRKLRSARFPLLTEDSGFTAVIDRWIRFSAAGGIEDLSLSPVIIEYPVRVELPSSLFCCCRGSSIPSIPSIFYGFPHLRNLVFTQVSIANDALEALLSACPRIEELTLSSVHEITSLLIRAPAMRHLLVYDCDGLDRVEIVHAPELRRLMYCGNLSIIGPFKSGAAPKLEEAALLYSLTTPDIKHPRPSWNLHLFIAHVKILSVSSWLFEVTLGKDICFGVRRPMFENLKELHWWPVFRQSLELLAEPWFAEEIQDFPHSLVSFLENCPYLEQLCILCTYYLDKETDECDDCSQQSSDDDDEDCDPLQEFEGVGYVLPRLKTVRMAEFSGKKGEMRLLEFLADKAVALETMNLYYVGQVREKLEEIRQQLNSFRRASPVARILISEYDMNMVCPKHENIWYEFDAI